MSGHVLMDDGYVFKNYNMYMNICTVLYFMSGDFNAEVNDC